MIAPEAGSSSDSSALRAAVADHLGRAPTRAELTAARRAAHSLAALGRARVLQVAGTEEDDTAGDRQYLVLAKRLSPAVPLEVAMSIRDLPFRRQVRHVDPDLRDPRTAAVRRQIARDFGPLVPPFALHLPAPDALCAYWAIFRERPMAAGWWTGRRRKR